QLGKRGLYPNIGGQVDQKSVSAILDLLAFADGTNDVVDIANATGHELSTLDALSDTLIAHGLLTTNVSHD
ncbi:MAG: aminopeptidase, partial [Actinobacteria bacterium]|nr:aminopeptidase [Actinomycetota bacterium]